MNERRGGGIRGGEGCGGCSRDRENLLAHFILRIYRTWFDWTWAMEIESTSWQCVPDGQLKALFMCNSFPCPSSPPELLPHFDIFCHSTAVNFEWIAIVRRSPPSRAECNNWSTLSVKTPAWAGEQGPTRGGLKGSCWLVQLSGNALFQNWQVSKYRRKLKAGNGNFLHFKWNL